MRVAIVGAGFSGIAMAIALRREGIEDFTVLERAGDLGGVWHHNTYPGAACDVPSYLYSYSYEQRRDWSQPCSPQQEILDYLHDTARKHGVIDRVRTGVEVERAEFDDRTARWTLHTTAGERIEADALVLACGQLSRPRWPSIPGMDEFEGHAFHSAEWDHGYDLAGRRVAVIGTGASAIQFVPIVAESVARMDVYQRSAPYMLPRNNPTYPTLMRRLVEHVPGLQIARRYGIWAFMELFVAGLTRVPPLGWLLRTWSTSFMRMQLRDPEIRRRGWPDYPFGCKRILFSSTYLPALQRPNVDLVTDEIARVTPRGVVTADGREREADCIVYGTGFRSNDFVMPMRVTGADGRDLESTWSRGAEAHLGITVSGFPNMFVLYGPNTNLGVGSIIVMIEAQVRYAIDALRAARRSGAALDVRPEVQSASSERVQERLRGSVWSSCRNWYRDAGTGRVVNNWPGFMVEYVRATRRVRPEEYREVRPVTGP
ncbi:MAG TPA: NAD(P)/FAD-dependent oxidoreductase [Thermoleophilaceae bacterium]|nr:NAD(P)/FAD-dependent oxidoreductase [Thermoleophilaceae bacterium]